MDFKELFKPYSPEIRGNLETYLREHDGMSADNFFHGPEYFFVIRREGFMIPNLTFVRVGQSPIPDIRYFVNSAFLLESNGPGEHYNMSLMMTEKGVYDPTEALKDKIWSILHLNLG